MSKYQLGKDIQTILEQLDRIERRLDAADGQRLAGEMKLLETGPGGFYFHYLPSPPFKTEVHIVSEVSNVQIINAPAGGHDFQTKNNRYGEIAIYTGALAIDDSAFGLTEDNIVLPSGKILAVDFASSAPSDKLRIASVRRVTGIWADGTYPHEYTVRASQTKDFIDVITKLWLTGNSVYYGPPPSSSAGTGEDAALPKGSDRVKWFDILRNGNVESQSALLT